MIKKTLSLFILFNNNFYKKKINLMSYPLSSVDISNQGLTELPKEIINQRKNIEFLDMYQIIIFKI